MRVVKVRNVTEAWARLPETLADAEAQDSRAGRVLVCPEPVATVYANPRERVLLDARRDANPFFHLIEALWMLAGRNDAATLNHYVRDFGARFGEPDGTIHGAYGHRWRNHLYTDQLDTIVEKLRKNPLDRQAVLQMWDGMTTSKGASDLEGDWKDRPCNTHAYFRVRHQYAIRGGEPTYDDMLDMTVLCRSNDMVFGGYGANAVHFSILQEYLAARIGVEVGTYTQMSNNFHVYEDVWSGKKPYAGNMFFFEPCAPMFDVPEKIDSDILSFMVAHEGLWKIGPAPVPRYANNWFWETAGLVVASWYNHKKGKREQSLSCANQISCPAWRAACVQWLERRV